MSHSHTLAKSSSFFANARGDCTRAAGAGLRASVEPRRVLDAAARRLDWPGRTFASRAGESSKSPSSGAPSQFTPIGGV
ncbi:hypothetical protein CLOP_g17144 [Closterium sp. NIES-67]|nr:hypothetical protein CLOP_g17144 [Closterium sp. NIES-67]